MKILFIQPTNSIGGAEISLLTLIKYLHTKGYKLYVAIPYKIDSKYVKLLKPYIVEFIFVKPMSWHRKSKLGLFQRSLSYLYRSYKSKGWHIVPTIMLYKFIKKHNINIVHTNTFMAIDGAFAAKISGIAHVQHVRESIGDDEYSLFTFPLQSKKELFKKIMNQLHDKIIVNSDFIKNISSSYFSSEKLVKVYNPLVDCFFDVKSTKNSPKKKINVGLVANVTSKIKNHGLFVDIARVCKEANFENILQFNIYGKLPTVKDEYYKSLRKKIKENNLESRVQFKGEYLNPIDMYNEIDIMIHTCNCESFGRVFIEAMAMGVPVIAADGGGASELIRNGENGFIVDVNYPKGFVDKIDLLIREKDVREKLVNNGKKYSLKFKSENTCREVETIYNDLIYDRV